jgi:hypothetical protein
MADTFEGIDDKLRAFIESQHMFFVGSAAPDGRVNISPKGMDSLKVMSPNRIVWLNLTGSENETAAHLLEHKRMTLMWCSFDNKPLIARVYGHASMVHPEDPGWDQLAGLFPAHPGSRQIYDLAVDFSLTSCGFAVPRFEFVSERDTLNRWALAKGEDGIADHWQTYNRVSIDGKPTGLPARKT